jgi:mannose-6-phosphate isomerase-like protein (cupin superfamily)
MQMHTFDRIAKYAAVICVAALALTGAGHLAPVTFIDHAKVQEATMKGGVLITAPDLQVLASSRSKPGEVEIHEKITDVLYVLDGEAIMVTGGTIVGGTTVPADPNAKGAVWENLDRGPGQIRGTDIKGGDMHHLTKGDVIVIPAGQPHWWKEVPHSISYYVVKINQM